MPTRKTAADAEVAPVNSTMASRRAARQAGLVPPTPVRPKHSATEPLRYDIVGAPEPAGVTIKASRAAGPPDDITLRYVTD